MCLCLRYVSCACLRHVSLADRPKTSDLGQQCDKGFATDSQQVTGHLLHQPLTRHLLIPRTNVSSVTNVSSSFHMTSVMSNATKVGRRLMGPMVPPLPAIFQCLIFVPDMRSTKSNATSPSCDKRLMEHNVPPPTSHFPPFTRHLYQTNVSSAKRQCDICDKLRRRSQVNFG